MVEPRWASALVYLFHHTRGKNALIIVDHFLSYGGLRYPRSYNHKEKCVILTSVAESRWAVALVYLWVEFEEVILRVISVLW